MPLPVTCHACGKGFSISDDIFEQKIKGRVVTVKCKQCQAPIRVDGTKGLAEAKVGPPPAAGAKPETKPPAPTTLSDTSAAPPAAPAAPDVAPSPTPAAAPAPAPEPAATVTPAVEEKRTPEPPKTLEVSAPAATVGTPEVSDTDPTAPLPRVAPSAPLGTEKKTPTGAASAMGAKTTGARGSLGISPKIGIGGSSLGLGRSKALGAKGIGKAEPAPAAAKPEAAPTEVAAKAEAPASAEPAKAEPAAITAALEAAASPAETPAPLATPKPDAAAATPKPDAPVATPKPTVTSPLGVAPKAEAASSPRATGSKAEAASSPRATSLFGAKREATAALKGGAASKATGLGAARRPAVNIGEAPKAPISAPDAATLEPPPTGPVAPETPRAEAPRAFSNNDETPAPPAADMPSPVPAAEAPAAVETPVAPTPSPATAAAESVSESLLFAVDLPGGDQELEAEQIADLLAKGTVNGDTLVWREGMAEWLEIKKVPELARHLKKPAPAPPPAGSRPGAITRPDAPAAKLPFGSKPQASTGAAPAGRFRPRQATLPMGVLPDGAAAKGGPAEARPASRAPTPPSARDQAAALIARESKQAELKAGQSRLPALDMPLADDEPTLLRASPLELFNLQEQEEEARPRAPMPTPVRELLGRQFEDAPSPPPSRAPAPPPRTPVPVQPSPERPPTDTFRATPEAKRSWFPETDSVPPPPPPPPVAPAARQPEPSASSAFAAAANAPFSAPVNAPAFGAPPQPFAAPAVPPVQANAPSFASAAAALDEVAAFRSQKKRRVVIILVALLLIAGVVGYIFMNRAPEPLPPLNPVVGQAAPPPAAVAATGAPAPATTAAAPSAQEVETPPSSATIQSATRAAPLPGAPATTASSGNFADLFAAGVKQANDESAGRFDPAAAKAALDAELVEAARCREPGGPTGITSVSVTFAPNGSVSRATIAEPPFAGTSVGDCICAAMKRARIKPFTGVPGTLTERISIR